MLADLADRAYHQPQTVRGSVQAWQVTSILYFRNRPYRTSCAERWAMDYKPSPPESKLRIELRVQNTIAKLLEHQCH